MSISVYWPVFLILNCPPHARKHWFESHTLNNWTWIHISFKGESEETFLSSELFSMFYISSINGSLLDCTKKLNWSSYVEKNQYKCSFVFHIVREKAADWYDLQSSQEGFRRQAFLQEPLYVAALAACWNVQWLADGTFVCRWTLPPPGVPLSVLWLFHLYVPKKYAPIIKSKSSYCYRSDSMSEAEGLCRNILSIQLCACFFALFSIRR